MSEENQNGEVEYFYITNEDGQEEKFEILYEFSNETTGYSYLLLVPFLKEEADQEVDVEVYPVRYKMVEDEPVYETIESDEEWGMIEEVLEALEDIDDDAPKS